MPRLLCLRGGWPGSVGSRSEGYWRSKRDCGGMVLNSLRCRAMNTLCIRMTWHGMASGRWAVIYVS